MSELPREHRVDTQDPQAILHRLPESERELFLSEYRAALDGAHEVWRYRQLQEVLTRWELVTIATSRPGYAEAIADVNADRGQYTSLEDVVARRAQ